MFSGVICLFALVLINAMPEAAVSAHLQMALLLVGVVGVTWGAGHTRAVFNKETGAHQKRDAAPLRWLVLILLLAAFVRLWQIGDAVHFFTDELHFADAVTTLRDNGMVGVLIPFHYIASFTWVYPYLQLGAVGVFGPELIAMRIVSAAFGVLTVAATYALAVELQKRSAEEREKKHNTETQRDRDTEREEKEEKLNAKPQRGRGAEGGNAFPLLAALTLALFPPHVHFSRLGLNNIADAFFGTLALALLLRAMRTGSARQYALAGAALGLTQYFYEGGRVLFPALIALWLGISGVMQWIGKREKHNTETQRDRGTEAVKGWVKPALRFVFVFGVIAAPVYITLLTHDLSVVRRLSRRGPDSIGYWLKADTGLEGTFGAYLLPDSMSYWLRAKPGLGDFIKVHLLPPITHFIITPDGSRFFYGGESALVLPWLVPFLLVGLWAAARRWAWLLLWLLLTIGGNSLIDYSDWTPRFVVAFPALAILIALGMAQVAALTKKLNAERQGESKKHNTEAQSYRGAGREGRSAAVFALVAALVLIFSQVVYYFGPHLARVNQQVRPLRDHQDVAFRARDFPPDTEIHIVSDALVWQPSFDSMMRFWGRAELLPFNVVLPDAFNAAYLDGLARDVDHAFFLEPDDADAILLVTRNFYYRAPEFSPFPGVPVERQYALFYAPHVLDGTEFPPE